MCDMDQEKMKSNDELKLHERILWAMPVFLKFVQKFKY